MTDHKLSEDAAAALIAGTAPSEHPELASLAASIAQLRSAPQPAPQPTAALIARIDLGIRPVIAPVVNKRRRTLASWFVGLGILAKLALGTLIAVTAVSSAGAAGILPGAAQSTFDHIVNIVVHPSLEIRNSPIGTPGVDDSITPSTPGSGVTDPARPGDNVADDNGVDPADDTDGADGTGVADPAPSNGPDGSGPGKPRPTPAAPGKSAPGTVVPGAPAPGAPTPAAPGNSGHGNSGSGSSGSGSSGSGNSGHGNSNSGNSGNSGSGKSGHGKPAKPGKDSNDSSGSGSGLGTGSGSGKSGGKGSGKN